MADQHPCYLGDGVYASFDGYHIWLKAGGLDQDDNQIALEPAVFEALVKYRREVFQALERQVVEQAKKEGG